MLPRLLVLAAFATVSLAAQGVTPEIRGRLDTLVKALSDGSAGAFEAMAQASFAPELLSRRTPDDRKRLVAQLHGELGELDPVDEIASAPGRFQIAVRGSKGGEATLMVELETSAPYRITNLGLRIGGDTGGGARDAGPAPQISASMPAPELAKALDAYLAPLAASGEFAGVVLVAKDGRPLFERGFGPADRERNIAMTPDLRFNIASTGKAFTKVAVGQLISQRKLALTDTIGAKLPDYPNTDARAATIEQLLNHTGGIPDFFGEEFDGLPKDRFASNADYYRYVASRPVLFAPNARALRDRGRGHRGKRGAGIRRSVDRRGGGESRSAERQPDRRGY